MVLGCIGTEYKYDLNEEKFKVAFDFLHRTDLAELPEGANELGYGVVAHIQHYATSKREELSFETHEKNFDIQYVIEGEEKMGVCSRRGLALKVPYETARDVTFYEDPASYGEVLLLSGDYILLSPEDAHKPRCTVSASVPVKKVVVKIPV